MSKIPTEYEEQKALVQWLRAKNIFFFAPTNENNSHKQNRQFAMIAEQKAKATGKLKGVSDLVIFTENYILFVEMKRRHKKLKSGKPSVSHTKVSKEQVDFLEKVEKFSYAKSKVCYGAKEAIEFVERYTTPTLRRLSTKELIIKTLGVSKEIIDEFNKHLTEEHNSYGYVNIIMRIERCLKLLGVKDEKS